MQSIVKCIPFLTTVTVRIIDVFTNCELFNFS